MKQNRSFSLYRATCVVSLFCVCLPLLAAVFRADMSGWTAALSGGLLAGGAVLLMLPLSEEQGRLSFFFSLGAAAVCCAGPLAALPARGWICSAVFLHLVYLTVRALARYAQLRPLFRHIAVWYNVENHARLLYSLVLFFLIGCFPSACAPSWGWWPFVILSVLFYAFLWIRVGKKRTALISYARELEIKELIRGNLRTAPPQAGEKTEDVAKMTRVYQRTVNLMEHKRPFLDAKYNLADMASAVFTNKTYLSKTINIFSGRNFSQFVNYYRIRYCVDLLRKDPNLRLTSAALMSGFHSTVTFNMAFKLNMGETPSSFKERLQMERQQGN